MIKFISKYFIYVFKDMMDALDDIYIFIIFINNLFN